MGATTGAWGTLRAQLHLRQVLAYLETHPLPRPEVLVTHAREKFDGEGRLVDESTRARVRELVVALRDWARFLKGAGPRWGNPVPPLTGATRAATVPCEGKAAMQPELARHCFVSRPRQCICPRREVALA
jgi:hypothetical protein